MHKMLVRALSGLVYVALIVGALLGGGLYTALLALLLASLAGAEFLHLTRSAVDRSQSAAMLDMAGILCLTAASTGIGAYLWCVLLLARMVTELYAKNPQPIRDLSVSVFSQLYIGVPMALLMGAGVMDYLSRGIPAHVIGSMGWTWALHLILAVFVLIWLNDTGAYLVGSMCGRHRMWERISPKKTWEGFAGGTFFCIGGAVACYFLHVADDMLTLPCWIGLGVVVAVFATWGDLLESLFKRSLHVKDSGHLIPGHGGILDRIDSFLLVLPATALYLLTVVFCCTTWC